MRWSLGAEGLVPRLTQRRVILFFCSRPALVGKPDLYGAGIDGLFARDFLLVRFAASFFKILDRVRRLRVMLSPRRQLAIVHRP